MTLQLRTQHICSRSSCLEMVAQHDAFGLLVAIDYPAALELRHLALAYDEYCQKNCWCRR
ncbi:hypothetical protein RRS04_004865 [Klebsiella aerogenes]|nr:hypothetical protein [Klebsiella aerogenes]ELI7202125.1 hypothetical protein [Klebsiella aerogenes]KLF02108.1 hypothetical protein YA24_13110 [Klebsiella aerogenes]